MVLRLVCFVAGAALLLFAQQSWAAPFAKTFHFTQPDNTKITIWGEGDEFRAIFETADGYTIIFDPQSKAYYYAKTSEEGSLVSTGVLAHHPPPSNLAKHTRPDPAKAAEEARARREKWDEETELSKRWRRLKSKRLGTPPPPSGSQLQPAPPSSNTLGAKVGLTLLIDFPDDTATISKSEVEAFLNGDSYAGFGNNGSIKEYFSDVSGSRLTYTNVVTAYIRMNQPKSYYNDVGRNCGDQGRLLITDAMAILKGRSDYTSTIIPTFATLTTDDYDQVVALNVLFTGETSGVWSQGLWPHSSSLSTPITLGNGKSLWLYQITNQGTALEIGTFCHENAHMLCHFPDVYDYDFDSIGGAGSFCLMNSGAHGPNPSRINPYLKLAAGWATATDLDSVSSLSGSLVAAPDSGHDKVYRFRRPEVSEEYFLLENRQQTGRDANLPAAGIAIWHVDELGNKNNQSLAPNSIHQNYELTLVQADNAWHFQNNANYGDALDLYYQGNGAPSYTGEFSDDSFPNANWWDGSRSGFKLTSFSASGSSMTFNAGPESVPSAPVLSAEPPVTPGRENTISWSAVSVTATTQTVEYYAESADNAGFTSPATSGWITQTQWTRSGLSNGTTYWYRVKARIGTQESGWSNVEYSLQEEFPTISGTPATSVMAGSAYSFVPTATRAARFEIVNRPSWADFDPATGALTGTPAITDAGSYPGIGITAVNGAGAASIPPFTITVQRPATRYLTVTVTGSGGGSVYISPLGVNCVDDGACRVEFPDGSNATLAATPDSNSTFAGWSGACQGRSTCGIAMTGDRSVTASFSAAPIISVDGVSYRTLQAACTASSSGTIIRARAIEYPEQLVISRQLRLRGGYNAEFTSNAGGYTTITGSMKIRQGPVTVERVVIR